MSRLNDRRKADLVIVNFQIKCRVPVEVSPRCKNSTQQILAASSQKGGIKRTFSYRGAVVVVGGYDGLSVFSQKMDPIAEGHGDACLATQWPHTTFYWLEGKHSVQIQTWLKERCLFSDMTSVRLRLRGCQHQRLFPFKMFWSSDY